MSNGTTSREFRPQAVLLDFYGTLVEEDEAVTQQISRRLAAASPARPATEAVGSFWSRCFQRLCAESCGPAFRSQRRVEIQSLEQTLREFRADGLSADELCRDQFEYWRRPSILPEVKSVLAACPVSVCVVSNTDDDDLQSALRHVGLRFDMVVTSEDCRSYRPRPEMFEKALSLLGLPAGEVLHIGDSIRSDIAGAKAAGIPMLWINPDGRQAPAELTPDYVSRDLTGLLEFFEHGHPV